jgi:hypothetical protein
VKSVITTFVGVHSTRGGLLNRTTTIDTQSLTTSSLWFSRFYRRVHFSTHLCNPAISR